jgi:regulator of sirC expression with transglutaminase-like and TPR domain
MVAQISENQKVSLFRLLSDDDPATTSLVKQQLLEQGDEAVPQIEGWLQEVRGSPAERHLMEVLNRLKHNHCHTGFLEYCARARIYGDTDLEEASFLLAATEYSATNMATCRTMLDEMAGEVKQLIGEQGSPSEIRALSQVLHEKHRFRGNRDRYYEAENTYINRVLERQVGIPITLSLLYIFVGRRVGLDVQGVALPGHFIVSWNAQYYDPFNNGRVLDEAACKQLVEARGQEFRREQLNPATVQQVLTRMLMNLSRVYEIEEDRPRHARVRKYLQAINP